MLACLTSSSLLNSQQKNFFYNNKNEYVLRKDVRYASKLQRMEVQGPHERGMSLHLFYWNFVHVSQVSGLFVKRADDLGSAFLRPKIRRW